MPKSETIDEFAALMADILATDTPQDALTKLAVDAPVVEAKKPDTHKSGDPKSRRDPVAKTRIEISCCPFESSVADEKGYVSLEFGRFSKAFLYGDKLEAIVRFFQKHGDEYLAKARAAGLK